MEPNRLKLEQLNQCALLVSTQAFNQALKYGFHDIQRHT